MSFVSSHTLFFHSTFKDLINQGRQKVLEATSALKSVPREPLEDIIAQVVSDRRRAIPYIEAVNQKGYTLRIRYTRANLFFVPHLGVKESLKFLSCISEHPSAAHAAESSI